MDDEGASFVAQFFGDRVRVRRTGLLFAAIFALFNGLAADSLNGFIPGLVYPLTWLALPFLALAIGYGDAFFIEHGIGVRRNLILFIVGVFAALAACVVLSTMHFDNADIPERIGLVVANLALYSALLLSLAAGIGLGLGRGLDYAGRKINDLDDEYW